MSARWIIAASPVGVLLGVVLILGFNDRTTGTVGLMSVLVGLAVGAVGAYCWRGARLHAAIRTGSAHVAAFGQAVGR